MCLSSAQFCTNSGKKIKQWDQNKVDLSFSLSVKTVLLGLVDKKQLEIILLLAEQYIYKALVNNTPVTFTAFQIFFKQKYEEQQHLAIISLTDQKLRNSWSLLSLLVRNI